MNRAKLEADTGRGLPELAELVAIAADGDIHALIPELPYGRSLIMVSASLSHGSMLTAIQHPTYVGSRHRFVRRAL